MLRRVKASPPPHRTQEQRRARTRTRLLEATIDSLTEVGYAGTTTRGVAERADVSQGAMTHHFPHRLDLITAALEHLTERRIAELKNLAAELPEEPGERSEALLELLWADFSSSLFTVFVKVWVAASDDAELYARLIPLERRLTRAIAADAAAVGGELTRRAGWEARLLTVLSTMRGLALAERFEPRGKRRRDPWPQVKETLLQTLGG